MVLKQRFSEGRTNYIDIGNSWMLIQKHSPEFETIVKREFVNVENAVDIVAFVCYGKNAEPICNHFTNWIYSNDGQLFQSIT